MSSIEEDPFERVKSMVGGSKEDPSEAKLLEEQLRRELRQRNIRFLFRGALLVLTVASVLNTQYCRDHLRAASRIGLIQLAPFWDWSDYYHRDCLLDKAATPDDNTILRKEPQCSFCEDLEGIDIVTNASIRFLMDHYISHGLPVIVNGGAMDWPLLQLDDLIQAYRDDDSGWGICSFMSNTRPFSDLEDFFQLVEQFPREKSWFAHWENCARKSVKTGRRFYQRPKFMTASVDLSLNNWILLSGNYYRAQRFKAIKLHSGLAMVAQIRGSNIYRLHPESGCHHYCPSVQLNLLDGDLVLLNPRRWNLDYLPGEEELNIAVIVQGEID